MKFYFDLNKKHVIALLGLIVLVGVVIAYGGNQPSVMGHTSGEINLVAIGNNLEAWANGANTALNGHETRITALETPSLSGAGLMEGRRYDIGTQQSVFPGTSFGIFTLAQYADVYTGGSDRGGYRGYVGCLRAITEYCQNEGYYTASVLSPTCGAGFANDAACPNVPGCTITFYCLKRHI